MSAKCQKRTLIKAPPAPKLGIQTSRERLKNVQIGGARRHCSRMSALGQKRTFERTPGMSAKCQKRTLIKAHPAPKLGIQTSQERLKNVQIDLGE